MAAGGSQCPPRLCVWGSGLVGSAVGLSRERCDDWKGQVGKIFGRVHLRCGTCGPVLGNLPSPAGGVGGLTDNSREQARDVALPQQHSSRAPAFFGRLCRDRHNNHEVAFLTPLGSGGTVETRGCVAQHRASAVPVV